MNSKIFIEGVDGAGKSTYINKIIKENPGMNYEVIHCTRHTNNNLKFFTDVIFSEKNVILDRSYVGQFVYNDYECREFNSWLSLKDLDVLEGMINNQNVKVVYVYSDIDKCLENCKKDKEDNYYTKDYLEELDRRYRYFFKHISKVSVSMFYNDYMLNKDKKDNSIVDYALFNYESLPNVVAVDFDGTLVENEFPNIGSLNTKLVNELWGDGGKYRNYHKILFTNRSGNLLIDACNFCAQNNLYFDAVNDDIPEVKSRLNRNPIDHRKIWFDVLIDDKAVSMDEYL